MEQQQLDIGGPGGILRDARLAKSLSLADVAATTRVPIRHLEALERNDLAALPSSTYCIGFARAYARAVGLDEVEIAAAVRKEVHAQDLASIPRYEAFEPADPARVPPRLLAWTAAAVALILAITYGVWRANFFSAATTDEDVPALAAAPTANRPARAPAPPPAPVGGPVVLTATAPVWLRIYEEEGGAKLLEKEMAQGESFTIPATAKKPLLLTGRPDVLRVTVGGRAVPPLGTADRTVADLPISAQALLARPAAPAPTPEP